MNGAPSSSLPTSMTWHACSLCSFTAARRLAHEALDRLGVLAALGFIDLIAKRVSRST